MASPAEILSNPELLNQVAHAAFIEVDMDESGFISQNELEALMKSIAQQSKVEPPSKQEIQDAMKALDTNNDGKLSFEEFKVLVVSILKGL